MTAPDQTHCLDTIPDVCESVRALDYAQCARRRGHEGDHRDLWGALWSEGDEPVSYDPARAEEIAAETVRADAEMIRQAVIDGLDETATPPSPAEQIADGLEQLAAFLRAHPHVPLPSSNFTYAVSAEGGDDVAIARVQAMADALGVDVERTTDGHHRANTHFGSIRFSVSYIEQEHALTPVYVDRDKLPAIEAVLDEHTSTETEES